nr:hypothetical protein asmbl_12 [uncultured bacterium]
MVVPRLHEPDHRTVQDGAEPGPERPHRPPDGQPRQRGHVRPGVGQAVGRGRGQVAVGVLAADAPRLQHPHAGGRQPGAGRLVRGPADQPGDLPRSPPGRADVRVVAVAPQVCGRHHAGVHLGDQGGAPQHPRVGDVLPGIPLDLREEDGGGHGPPGDDGAHVRVHQGRELLAVGAAERADDGVGHGGLQGRAPQAGAVVGSRHRCGTRRPSRRRNARGPRSDVRCGALLRSGELRGRLVDRQVPGAVRVDRDARAHGGRDGDLLDVPALGRGRLGAQHLVQGGGVVLHQLGLVEGGLADHQVQVGLLVDAEVDLPALDVVDGLGDVGGHGAGLRVRHQATGAEDAGDAAHLGHLVRRRDRGVEVQEAALDPLDQVVGADDVGAGGLGLGGLVTGREHDDAGGLAGAVRQVDGAADHLVGLARVDAQPDRDLDGGVVAGGGGPLGQTGRLQRAVQALVVDLRGRLAVLLAVLRHGVLLPPCSGVVW